jgi:hypothetical protein
MYSTSHLLSKKPSESQPRRMEFLAMLSATSPSGLSLRKHNESPEQRVSSRAVIDEILDREGIEVQILDMAVFHAIERTANDGCQWTASGARRPRLCGLLRYERSPD